MKVLAIIATFGFGFVSGVAWLAMSAWKDAA